MSASISSPPSVDELLGRLHDEQDRISALRRGVIHGVPRPPLLIILLVLTMTGLVVAMTIQVVVMGGRMERTLLAIREHRAHLAIEARALPPSATLIDATAFTEALAGRPLMAGELWSDRGEALLEADASAALKAFDEARLCAVSPLPESIDLRRAQALERLERHAEARATVLKIDLGKLSPQQRQEAIALLGR